MTLVALSVLAASLASWGVWAERKERRRRRRAKSLRRKLYAADGQVNKDFHRARRAMNDAAGQSWRNLTG